MRNKVFHAGNTKSRELLKASVFLRTTLKIRWWEEVGRCFPPVLIFNGCYTSRLPYLIGPTHCSSSLLLLSNRGFLQYFGLHFLLSFHVVNGGAVNKQSRRKSYFFVLKIKTFLLVKILDKNILRVKHKCVSFSPTYLKAIVLKCINHFTKLRLKPLSP